MNEKPKQGVIHDWTREDFMEYRRTISRIAQRKRREAAKEKGLCSICAKKPARQGKKTCTECSNRANEWHKRKRNEVK